MEAASNPGIVLSPSEYRRSLDNGPDCARQICDASLRRLGVEQIDLYYVHRVDKDRPVEERMEGLAGLVDEGKLARIGLWEVSAETLRRANAVHLVSAVQTECSLWSRGPEAEVLSTCRELCIGFVPYSPLGRGFLTGRFQDGQFEDGDFRASLPRFQDEAAQANRRIADLVAMMAERKGCTPAQLALAWLLAQGRDIVPSPGTKQPKYLRDNVGAVAVTPNLHPPEAGAWRSAWRGCAGGAMGDPRSVSGARRGSSIAVSLAA
ncbi:aldo/keto reductase [Roseivivax halodurans JCM 10272]|uniref:Aldo/keto reductase n=1 Tax=Roseivivax halodurans JCM 10272 TaxID=1449350 RepID=X7EE16_9RHOB|nr:aldo/keto reductase [Roseivivax halodurans]ETX13411.1 aldo/keto reductase [Roseivivax halodurans JCM 10272]